MEPDRREDDKFLAARERLLQLREIENSPETKVEAFARERRSLICQLGIESFLEHGSEREPNR